VSEHKTHQKTKEAIECKSNFLRRTLNSDRVEADTITLGNLFQTFKIRLKKKYQYTSCLALDNSD